MCLQTQGAVQLVAKCLTFAHLNHIETSGTEAATFNMSCTHLKTFCTASSSNLMRITFQLQPCRVKLSAHGVAPKTVLPKLRLLFCTHGHGRYPFRKHGERQPKTKTSLTKALSDQNFQCKTLIYSGSSRECAGGTLFLRLVSSA